MLANVDIAAQTDKFEGWANLLYLLLVLIFPALSQFGKWIRDRSAADKGEGKQLAGVPPKPPKEVTRPPQTQAVSKPQVAEKARHLPSAETKSKPGPRKVREARPVAESPQAPAEGALEELFGPVLGDVIKRAVGEQPPAARPAQPSRREPPPPAARKAQPPAKPVPERRARPPAPATTPTKPPALADIVTHAEYKPHWTEVEWEKPEVQVHLEGVHARKHDPTLRIAQLADAFTPVDLRTAVILSEILRPPLAMREPEGWGR